MKIAGIFVPIKKQGFVCKLVKANALTFIPNGTALSVTEELWKMCQWIYKEFVSEFDNLDSHVVFRRRNISRTISYVVHISLLEGVIQRMYKDMFIELNRYSKNNFIIDKYALKERESEMSAVILFRNKVAAHTAYGSPRGENLSAQFWILSKFISCGWNNANPLESFELGHLGSLETQKQAPSTMIPSLNIYMLEKYMQIHYANWVKMFVSELNKFDKEVPYMSNDIIIEKERQ